MSSEYNSKLIVNLGKASKTSEVQNILSEMEEIGDPVFIYPIYEKWKSYSPVSFISHYFISTLSTINSPDVLKIAQEILFSSKSLTDICWVYPIFEKYNSYEIPVTSIAVAIIQSFSTEPSKSALTSYNLFDLLSYLEKAKEINDIAEDLRKIVLNEDIEQDVRGVALKYLLRINPKSEFRYFIDNFDTYKTDTLCKLLAKEVILWHGGETQNLLALIREKGLGRSKDIIEEFETSKQKREKKEIEMQTSKYSNIPLIIEIADLRKKINTLSITNEKIGFEILTGGSQLIEQQETVFTNDQLITKCISLRELFLEISDKTKLHTLTPEQSKKILPNQSEANFNKPINRLVLFLHSKGIKINTDIYELRQINQIANLITHPEQQQEFITAMKELEIYELYKSKQWSKFHQELLTKYKKSLQKLLEQLA